MITALSTPGAGRVLLDGNNTKIVIQSTNGEGYYFRAKIFVDGILLDEQGWSRQDAYTATKDLKMLYNAYFTPQFQDPVLTLNGLQQQTHLMRYVTIEITEYNLSTGAVTGTLNLPGFTIMYNAKPVTFNDSTRVDVLGVEPTTMRIAPNGIIALPIYTNATNQALIVSVATNSDTLLYTETIPAFTGKRVYLLRYKLTGLSYNVLYVTVNITVGTTTKKITYRINRLPAFPFKTVAFTNNFGYYLYAYFDGELEMESALSPQSFVSNDGREHNYEIQEDVTYTLHTGSLTDIEKPLVNMIANSLNVKITQSNDRNASRTGFKNVVVKTKKVLTYRDRTSLYDTALVFTAKAGTDVVNAGMIIDSSSNPDIYITGHSVEASHVTLNFVFNNGFTAPFLLLQRRNANSTVWGQVVFTANSPGQFSISPGSYYIRLVDPANDQNISNQISITV